MYKFITVSKVSKINKHLPTDLAIGVQSGIQSRATSFLDFNDLPNSSLPSAMKWLSKKDWNTLEKTGCVNVTKRIVVTVKILKK